MALLAGGCASLALTPGPCTWADGRFVPEGEPFAVGVRRPGPAATNPQLVYRRNPQYTSNAMREKAMGETWLQVVVLPTGRIGDIRVVRRLHPELDREAVCAASQWVFTPPWPTAPPCRWS
ncbi:MAG: TonB family protein [Vicinamibacterales bacterium]